MEIKENYKVCKYDYGKNCFARREKIYCDCLTNTKFKNGRCPFYKSKKTYEQEQEKCKRFQGGKKWGTGVI